MTAREQLAEMASENALGVDLAASVRLSEYRAVLRWFADRVNERAKEMWEEETGLVEYPSAYCTACAMTELLKELDASPAPASCRKCGERIRGMASGGLCGLCADQNVNWI